MVNELAEDVLAINPSIAVTLRVGDHVPCPSERRKNHDLPDLLRKTKWGHSVDQNVIHWLTLTIQIHSNPKKKAKNVHL